MLLGLEDNQDKLDFKSIDFFVSEVAKTAEGALAVWNY